MSSLMRGPSFTGGACMGRRIGNAPYVVATRITRRALRAGYSSGVYDGGAGRDQALRTPAGDKESTACATVAAGSSDMSSACNTVTWPLGAVSSGSALFGQTTM